MDWDQDEEGQVSQIVVALGTDQRDAGATMAFIMANRKRNGRLPKPTQAGGEALHFDREAGMLTA